MYGYCFYQYYIDDESAMKLRFSVEWDDGLKFYECRCLAMGMSASSFLVQSLNEVLVNCFMLKFDCYCRVFCDDFWHSSKASTHFDHFASEYGLVFKSEKKESGSVITILGIKFNLQLKTAQLDDQKAEAIATTANQIIQANSLSPATLSALVGRVEYASQVCPSGRAKTFFLNRMLSDDSWRDFRSREDWIACEDAILSVSQGLEGELSFWSRIREHEPLKIGRTFSKCLGFCSSDASTHKFGFTIGGSFLGGSYPRDVIDQPIAVKEAFALAFLAKNLQHPSTDYLILVDNQAVAGAFVKGRSSNPEVHRWISQAKDSLLKLHSTATIKWINTATMSRLADGPSRGLFPRDEHGLTAAGADRIKFLSADFTRRLGRGDMVSAFSGPRNNPFCVPYYSIHQDLDDGLCKRREVFSVFEELARDGKACGGGIFAYPPPAMVEQFCWQVNRVGLERDTQLFLLAPGFTFQSVRGALGGVGQLSWVKFCGPAAKAWFWKKTGQSMMFFTLSSFD